jgi:leucyl/phenylalanyl-tRNA--protein transferase
VSGSEICFIPEEIKVSKSMRKILNRNVFTFSENKNFREVIKNCQQTERKGQTGTWLSDELMDPLSAS